MSVVGAMAVAGTVISAQADPADGWSVAAAVAPTPAEGVSDATTAVGLAAVAGLGAGSEVAAGSELTYVLTVTRSADAVGEDLASVAVVDDVTGLLDNAKVTGTLPDGVLFDGANVTWTTPDMSRGNTASTYFQVTVNDNATVGASLSTGAGLGDLACSADSCATSLTVEAANGEGAPATTDTDAPATDETTDPADTTGTDAPATDPSTDPADTTDASAGSDEAATPPVSFTAANEDGELIAGAAFSITGDSGAVFCVIDNDAQATVPNCDGGTVVSDTDATDGAFLVAGLPADSYTIAAILPPPDFELTDETKEVTLEAASDGTPFRGMAGVAFARDVNDGGAVAAGMFTFTSTSSSTATITVHVGGDRTGTSSVDGLAGVTFTATRSGESVSCVTNAQGQCPLTVIPNSNGSQYVVSQTGVADPTKWYLNPKLDTGDSSTGKAFDYTFTTTSIKPGDTIDVPGASLNGGTTGNGTRYTDNSGRSDYYWKNGWAGWMSASRVNPPASPQCGLKMALILDTSGSMGSKISSGSNTTKISALQTAATSVIDTLTGTPTQMAIYTFGQTTGASKSLTALTDAAAAQPLKNLVNGLTANGGTNWDQGIYQAVTQTKTYDLVVVLTDGNPTTDNGGVGGNNTTYFHNVDNAIFSANALKALNTRVVAIGIGVDGGDQNLRAISGQTQDSDFYLATGTNFGDIFKKLTTGNCTNKINITKTTQNANGTTIDQDLDGWKFTGSVTGANGATIGAFAPTGADGKTQADLSIQAGQTATVTITEAAAGNAHDNYSFQSLTCKVNGNTPNTSGITQPDRGIAFKVQGASNVVVSCAATNKQKPGTIKIIKKANPSTTQSFGFTTTGTGLSSFSLKGDGTDGPKTFSNLNPGTFTVTESATSGWSLDTLQCDDANSTTSVGDRKATINVDPGETVTCTFTNKQDFRPLTVDKTVTASYQSEAKWKISKSVDKTQIVVGRNGSATFNYTVTATPDGSVDSGWIVGGTITVTNPNPFPVPGVTVTDVPTGVGGGASCTVTGGAQTVPASGSAQFAYTCTIPTKPNYTGGTNKATASWTYNSVAGSASSAAKAVAFTAPTTLKNSTIHVTDDKTTGTQGPLGSATWDDKGTPTPFTYKVTQQGAAGQCVSYNNTAKITETGQTAQQSVQVCQTQLTVKKVDADAPNVVLKDAVFQLWHDVNGDTDITSAGVISGNSDDAQVAGSPCTTSAVDGTCSISGLAFGQYYWKELTAPTGYTLPAKLYSDIITIDEAHPAGTVPVTTFADARKTAMLTLVKQDQAGNPLEGAKFELWLDSNATSGLQMPGDTMIKACTTTADGTGDCTALNQPFGTYYWVETQAPAGYVLPASPANVTGPVIVNAANDGKTVTTTVKNSKLDPVTVTKTPGTATQNTTTGIWTVTYTVTVHNPNGQASVYSLSDTPKFAAGVTVTGASATYNGGSAGSWDSGSRILKGMATDRPIAAGANHEYTVTVTAKVPSSVSTTDRACVKDTANKGFYNEATVTSFGISDTDDACINIPAPVTPVLAKSVVGHPVQGADGNWTITYRVTATNSNSAATDYTLTDSLKYGAGITVVSSGVTGPAGVTLTNGWTGTGSHTEVAKDVVLPATTTHTYTVTVTAKVNGSSASTTARDCDLVAPETGTGFLNSATLTSGGDSDTKTACDSPVSPTITKAFNGTAATQHLVGGVWDGTWDAEYTVKVTNPSTTTDLVYSLSDTPDLPAGVTVTTNGASAKLGAASVGAWNGTTIAGMATNRPLAHNAAGTASESYIVSLNVRIDNAVVNQADLTCATPTPAAKKGLYNKATVVSGSDSYSADACGTIPQAPTPDIFKDVRSVQQGTDAAGTWTVTYDVRVVNSTHGGLAGVYKLTDTLAFGGGITVKTATVTSLDGVATNGDWDGGALAKNDATIVASGVIPADTTYTFRVTVTATIAAGAAPEQLDCDETTGGPGTGFLNKAAVSSGSTTIPAKACATPARPTITKTAGTPTQHLVNGTWDGVSWNVPYTITVRNPSTVGTNVTYTLSDTPAYPAGVTASGGSVTSATSTDSTTPTVAGADHKGTFAGGKLTIIGAARDLAAGKTDTFGITIVASVPADQDSTTLACQGTTPKHGFANVGTVTSGAYTADASACVSIPQVGKPTIAKTVTSVTQNPDGSWTTVYSVVVNNSANGYATKYSLTDAPEFGGNINITSATATGPAGAISTWGVGAGKTPVLTSGATVAARGSDTYTVSITANVTAGAYTGGTATCATDVHQSAGHGFFNKATLTIPGSQDQDASDCASPVTPTLAKKFVSAVQHAPGGVWDGTWDVTYTVTVTNPSQTTALVYSLSDEPAFPSGVTITGAISSPTGSWDSVAKIVKDMAKDKALAAQGSDVYTVVVNASVGSSVADGDLTCATPTPNAGQGFYNDATVTSGGYTATKNDCGDIQRNPKPTVVKTMDGAPVQQADGTWNIAYKLTVTNPSATQQGRFDLSDAFHFGGGITITAASAKVTGEGASTTWNGVGDTVIVTDHTIAKGGTLEYHVTVNASIAKGTADADRLCDATPSANHGFFNTATISVDGVKTDSSVCASPAKPTITKTFKSVEQTATSPWDGKWLVTYEVKVTNPDTHGTALLYSLSDTPAFPTGVTINGATASPQGTWNAPSITGMATDKSLAAGATDTYSVTVTVTLGSNIAAGDMTCASPNATGKGLYNKAIATSGNDDVSAIDCGDIPGPAKPALDKSVIGTPVQGADGNWTIQYLLTVNNSANTIAAKYSLTDDLAGFASGITVQSRTVLYPGAASAVTWNGTDALATDRSIAAGGVESYTVTVVATVTDQTKDEDRACDAVKGSGHGFFNAAKLTAGGTDDTKTACASPATPEITKTFVSAQQSTVSPWDGTWDVTYTVAVHNTDAATGLVYSLSDSPDYATGITVNSATAKLGAAAVGDPWNGTTIANMANNRPLAGNATDTYTVTVNVTVADTVTGDALTCAQSPTPDRGLYNKATATSGDDSYEAKACGTVPNPPKATVAKTVTSATQNANGTWTVVYDLVVDNDKGSMSAPYTLSDTLAYGGNITVDSATVKLPGGAIHATWNGTTVTSIVTNGVIAPTTTLHFTVTVTATVGATATPGDMDCTIDGNETGTGFLNKATLKSGANDPQTVEACTQPVRPTITKTAGTPTQNIVAGDWNGTWNVPYTITVTNPSTDGRALKYTLSDTTRFPGGVAATAGAVTSSNDGSGAAVPGITGGGAGLFSGTSLSIITDQSGPRNLAAGETDTFQIAITATVPVDQDAATLACKDGVTNHGFDNLGTVTSGGTSLTDDGCSDIPAPAKPTITKALDGQPVQDSTTGYWTIKYTLTVDNSAGKVAANYTLADKLDYGTGIDVKTSAVAPDPSGNWNGTSHQTVVTGATIAAGATTKYAVTVTAEVTDKATTGSATCKDQTTPGHGFFNGATLTVGNTSSNSTVCAEPALPTVNKTFVSAADNAAGGWDVTYTITVTNPSADKALYFSLTDTPEFAAGVDVTGAEVTKADVVGVAPGTWDKASGTLTIIPAATPVSLGAGDTDSFTIVVSTAKPTAPIDPTLVACTVQTPTPGHGFYNRADATSGGATITDTDCAGVPAWTVAKTVDKQTAQPGDTLTYTLTAKNTGTVDVTGAKGTDTLPANVTLVEPLDATLTKSVDGKTLSWAIPAMAAKGTASVTYQVTVDKAAAGTTQTNLVVPDGPGGSCEPSQGQDSNCKTNTDVPRWTLRKDSDPATGSVVQVGSTIKYTLTVTNKGPKALSGASVIDDLSGVLNNAAFVAGSITASGTGSAALAGTSLTWTLPSGIAVNDTATVSYSVTVNAGARGVTLTNVATPDPKDPAGICEPSTDPNAPANANCTTTHRTPPPIVIPNTATPAYTIDQCVLGDNGKPSTITVSTVAATGIGYTMTGNGTGAVTIVATAQGGYELNVPSGWSGNTSSASITVRAADATICVGGESSTTTPPPTTSAGVNVGPSETIEVLPSHGDIAYTGVDTVGMSALALLLLVLGGGLLWMGMAGWRRPTQH